MQFLLTPIPFCKCFITWQYFIAEVSKSVLKYEWDAFLIMLHTEHFLKLSEESLLEFLSSSGNQYFWSYFVFHSQMHSLCTILNGGSCWCVVIRTSSLKTIPDWEPHPSLQSHLQIPHWIRIKECHGVGGNHAFQQICNMGIRDVPGLACSKNTKSH